MDAPIQQSIDSPHARQVFKTSSHAVLAAQDKESLHLEGAKQVLKYMQNLWKNNQLCDVVFECNGGRLYAHKVALGAYSEKLSRNFTGYSTTELLTVDMREFTKESVYIILVFVYTTELNLSSINVGDVLSCAAELEVSYVKNCCIVFLSDNISVTSVFGFMDIAAKHHLSELQARLDAFLTEHFGEIITTEGFLCVAGDRLMRLLTDHRVSRTVGELAVFLAVVRWVESRRDEREPLLPALMRLVNFHLISPKDLINHVEKITVVTNNMETFQMLYSAMSYHALRMGGSDVYVMSNNKVYHNTSTPDWTQTYVGAPYLGMTAKAHNEQQAAPAQTSEPPAPPGVELRSAMRTTQVQLTSPPDAPTPSTPTIMEPGYTMTARPRPAPQPEPGYTMTARPRPVPQPEPGYTMTARPRPAPQPEHGFTMSSRPRPAHQPEPVRLPDPVPPPPQPVQAVPQPPPPVHKELTGSLPPSYNNTPSYRSYAHFVPTGTSTGALVVVAVGGIEMETASVNTPGRCVYQYDPQGSAIWRSLTNMPLNTHHHGVAMVNDKLYVVGGASYSPNPEGDLGVAMGTVNMFDLRTRRWSDVARLNCARSYLSVAADDLFIYAVGGEDENRNRLGTIERYDPRFNNWTHLTNIPSGPKVGASSAVLGGKLYVIGGYNSRRGSMPVMADVECYDLYSHQWLIKRNLPEPRCHAGLVVCMGRLYLIGGRTKSLMSGVNSMSSILCYNEAQDTWQHVANLHTPRHDAGCVAIGSSIYIVGGIMSPSPSCLAAVECWDCTSGQWRHHVPNLPYTAAGLGACALRL